MQKPKSKGVVLAIGAVFAGVLAWLLLKKKTGGGGGGGGGGGTPASGAKFSVGDCIQYGGNPQSAILRVLDVTDVPTVTGKTGGSYLVEWETTGGTANPVGTRTYLDIQTGDAYYIKVTCPGA